MPVHHHELDGCTPAVHPTPPAHAPRRMHPTRRACLPLPRARLAVTRSKCAAPRARPAGYVGAAPRREHTLGAPDALRTTQPEAVVCKKKGGGTWHDETLVSESNPGLTQCSRACARGCDTRMSDHTTRPVPRTFHFGLCMSIFINIPGCGQRLSIKCSCVARSRGDEGVTTQSRRVTPRR